MENRTKEMSEAEVGIKGTDRGTSRGRQIEGKEMQREEDRSADGNAEEETKQVLHYLFMFCTDWSRSLQETFRFSWWGGFLQRGNVTQALHAVLGLAHILTRDGFRTREMDTSRRCFLVIQV